MSRAPSRMPVKLHKNVSLIRTSEAVLAEELLARKSLARLVLARLSENFLLVKPDEAEAHYSLADVPGWAKSEEVKTAFPTLAASLAQSQPAQDSLVMNGSDWQVAK